LDVFRNDGYSGCGGLQLRGWLRTLNLPGQDATCASQNTEANDGNAFLHGSIL
jgi:hypothetical protein